MADGTVDNLNIQISAEARSAEKSLNSLSSTLLKVNKDLLSSVGSIRKVSKEVGTLKSTIDSIGKVNMNSSGVNKTLNSFKRMFSADMSNFDSGAFRKVLNSLQAFSSIPDVSNNINRFISSIARLANAGDKTGQTANNILRLGTQTKLAAKELKGIGAISNDLNLFVQSVGRLASAGGKTSQTASGLGALSKETLEFFKVMQNAPRVRENTIRMTTALAQLANAGGKVGTATGTITNSFHKLSSVGSKTGNVISKAASKIVSSFNAIGSSGGKIKLATNGFSNLFRSLAPFLGIYGIFDLGRKAIELSSDLTEVQNVVRVSFGDMEEYANNFAKTAMKQFGLSELAAKQYAGTMMAVLNSSGVERRTAAEMSTTLAGLAGDLASFYNISQDTAWERIMSGMAGEIEPLRRLGINLSVANLQAYALSQGITKSWQAMSQAEQVMLRYNYLMELTTAQQGDYARTIDTWANQLRLLSMGFQQLGAVVGGALINVFKPFVKALNSVMGDVIEFAETVTNALGAIFGWKLEVSGGSGLDDSLGGVTEDLGDAAGDVGDLSGGLGDAAVNADKLKKALSVLPFDQLNQLSENLSSSGSGGSGGAGGGGGSAGTSGTGDGMRVDLVQTDTIFEDYESQIENLYELGEYIGKTLTEVLEGIDWESVYQGARNFGKGLAEFLNGLISPELFSAVGKTIANSLNTVLHSLDSFGETFDWANFGLSIAGGINGFFENFDFGLLASTITTWANGLASTVNEFVKNTNWGEIGESISFSIRQSLIGINWYTVYNAASEFGKGMAEFLNGLITPTTFSIVGRTFAKSLNTVISSAYSFLGTIDWETWGDAIAESINGFFDDFDWETAGLTFNEAVNGILDMLIEALDDTHWDEVGDNIATFIENIEWPKILSRVGELIWKAINAGLSTWKNLFDAKPIETTIITAILALKFTGLGSLLGKKIWGSIKKGLLGTGGAAAAGAGAGSAASGGIFSTLLSGIKSFSTQAVSYLAPVGTTLGVVFAGVEVQKFTDYLRGGNGELSEFGGLLDSISTSGVFNNELNEKIFKLKEDLEDSNASTEEWRKSFVNLFKDAGVSAETLNTAYLNMLSTMALTADQQELMKGIISELGTEAELSADKVEKSGLKTGDAFQIIKDGLLEIQTQGILSAEEVGMFNDELDRAYNSGETATTAFSNIYDWILNVAYGSDEAKKELDGIKSQLETGIPNAASTANTGLGNIVSSLSGLSGTSEDAADKSGALYTAFSGLNDISGILSSAGLLILSTLTGTFGANAKSASDNTGDLSENLSNLDTSAAVSSLSNLSNKFDDIVKKTKESEGIGKNWTEGLANGIKLKSDDVDKNILEINNLIIDNTKNQLGVHSPSTISFGIGKDWIQGLINGHNSLKKDFISQVELLYSEVKDVFKTAESDFRSIAETIVSGLNNGLSEYSSVIESIETILDSIEDEFGELSLYSKGQSVMNSFVRGLKSVRIPKLSITFTTNTVIDGTTATTSTSSNISWYKKGGLFVQPSVIGLAEAGKEAVLPLENRRTMSMIADSIMESGNIGVDEETLANAVARGVAIAMMNDSKSQQPINLYAELKTENDEVLARAVARGQQRLDYRNNATPQFGY